MKNKMKQKVKIEGKQGISHCESNGFLKTIIRINS